MADFIDLLAGLQQSQTLQPDWPVIVGFCHSYDYSTGEQDLRRIRVNYMSSDSRLTVSPLLYRCSMSPGSDRQVPPIGALVIGLWTVPDKTAGVYLGFVQNQEQVTNFDSTRDWSETVDGVLTIKAERMRFIAENGIELIANCEMPNFSRLKLGDDPTGGNASDISFRDGYECELTIRTIYNSTILDESPELDA